jgi:hypothetical protein
MRLMLEGFHKHGMAAKPETISRSNLLGHACPECLSWTQVSGLAAGRQAAPGPSFTPGPGGCFVVEREPFP